MNFTKIFGWGTNPEVQEIKWVPTRDPGTLETVLVDSQRVVCSPGLRFTDEEAIKLSQRSGWILSFAKVQELEHQGVFIDWVLKAAAEPKLQYFTNCLLKLEEKRSNEKIKLTEDQRRKFSEQLCNELIAPTGLEPEKLLKEGYFVMRKLEENRTSEAVVVEAKKKEFAKLKALPPMIATALAMKELAGKNDLLEFESAHEKSSIVFSPTIKNLCSTGIDATLDDDYQALVGDLSNISLEHDITVGAMNSLMEQSAISDPDPADVSALASMLDENMEKAQKAVQKMQQHKHQLALERTHIEETASAYQHDCDALNQTISKRNREIAQQNAEIESIKRDLEMAMANKDEEVGSLQKELEETQMELAMLKQENRGNVPAEALHEAEDEVSDLQEKLKAQNKRQKTLQTRMENIKLECNSKIDVLKHENKALIIKKENLEKTLRAEKQIRAEKQQELDEAKAKCEKLRLHNDDLESTIQKFTSNCRRLSSTKTEVERIRHSSSQSDDVFQQPKKASDVSVISKMVTPDTVNPEYIMATDNGSKTKTVTQLLPKWSAGENIRNYTKRVAHAWEFVKGDFEEKKFCNLVRISVSANLGEIIDNYLTENESPSVQGLCEALTTKLDKRPSEYISEFKSATRGPSESYTAYAHRLRELYKKGTETTGKMNSGEKRLLVEQFLEGIPYSESSTLKLVASDEEMLDVDALAKRAARTSKPREAVTTIAENTQLNLDTLPESNPHNEEYNSNAPQKEGPKFNCFYCGRPGHGWRSCFRRAREDPYWRPRPHSIEPNLSYEPDDNTK